MDKPSQRLTDLLKEIDEARNASPRVPQQPSEIVKERNARLAEQADRIAALRRAREAAGLTPRSTGDQRELIDTGTDKRYVRRNSRGQFKESDDVGRSLAADRRRRAKTKSKPGEGDKGDRPRTKTRRKTAARKSAKKTARKKAARR